MENGAPELYVRRAPTVKIFMPAFGHGAPPAPLNRPQGRAHGIIPGNVHVSIGFALRGGRCRAFTGDTAIRTPTLPPYRYPDASAACGELQYKRIDGLDALVNPALVVEVTSPSRIGRDEGDKLAAYQSIATLREYILVSQEGPRVTRCTRREGCAWERPDVADMEASLDLESVGCPMKMRDIYDGLTFPA